MDAGMKRDYSTVLPVKSLVARRSCEALPILKRLVSGGVNIKALDAVQDANGDGKGVSECLLSKVDQLAV